MQSIFERAVLLVTALFYALTAWSAFAHPVWFGASIGFSIPGADGLNEVRAQYGGFFLAAAVVNAFAIADARARGASYVVNVVIFGGLLLGRLVSLGLDGGPGGYGRMIRSLFFIDATGLALTLAAVFAGKLHPAASQARALG
jgi:hypothetical protein